MRLAGAAVITTTLLMMACAGRKQHLSQDYGVTNDHVFQAQIAAPKSGSPSGPVTGLDSQEAAIIADTYRASLAPKGGQAQEQPILIVSPQTRERPNLPPPSVPPK